MNTSVSLNLETFDSSPVLAFKIKDAGVHTSKSMFSFLYKNIFWTSFWEDASCSCDQHTRFCQRRPGGFLIPHWLKWNLDSPPGQPRGAAVQNLPEQSSCCSLAMNGSKKKKKIDVRNNLLLRREYQRNWNSSTFYKSYRKIAKFMDFSSYRNVTKILEIKLYVKWCI